MSESSYCSEGCSESSEASFRLASEDFQLYDDSAEPIATEEATKYAELIAVEEEEEPEDMLLNRFADNTDL